MKKGLKISYKTTVMLSLSAVLLISLGYLLFQRGGREGIQNIDPSGNIKVAAPEFVDVVYNETPKANVIYDLPPEVITIMNMKPEFVNSFLNIFNNGGKLGINAAISELNDAKTFLATKKNNRTTQIDNAAKQLEVIYKRLNYLLYSLDALYISPNFKSLSPNIKSIQTSLKSNGYVEDTPVLNGISTGLDEFIRISNTPLSEFPGWGANNNTELVVNEEPVGAQSSDLLQTKGSLLQPGTAASAPMDASTPMNAQPAGYFVNA